MLAPIQPFFFAKLTIKLRLVAVMIPLVLTACAINTGLAPTAVQGDSQTHSSTTTPTPMPISTTATPVVPTATLVPPTARPASTLGTVTGNVCYPSSETPPMTLYLKHTVTSDVTTVEIKRGQVEYSSQLPPGHYTAYADTAGMGLRGHYSCGTGEPCLFQVEPGQTVTVDLCRWYSTPGVKPPTGTQSDETVVVKLLQKMFARTGPHLSYPEVGLVEADTVLPAVSRSLDGEWLQVEHPDLGVSGWLHAPLVQILGNPNRLPAVDEGPAQLPTSPQFVPALWRSSENRAIVQFKGEIRDQNGRLVNGYSVLIDNGTWSVLSHPTGASHHYPDTVDGRWDVVISNETDAAGWWTMTLVRYECPDFETGFNAQCKQFSPLSETQVVHVIHPDENIIEANWTCLEKCDQGLYIKSYRFPLEPIADNFLLYVEERALKSSPASPVFDTIEMRTIYDPLADTPTALKEYLADNRPQRSPDGRYLIINGPLNVTWLANLESGALQTLSQPAVQAAWSPDSQRIAYLKGNTLYIFDLAANQSEVIWQTAQLLEPKLTWPDRIMIEAKDSAWRISPDGLQVSQLETSSGESMESFLTDYLTERGFGPPTAWALAHDQQRIALNVQLDNPLKNAIILFDLGTQKHTVVGPINGYRVPEIRWTAGDDLLLIGATNPKFPSGGAIFTMLPETDVLPNVLLESDTAYLVDILPQK